MTEIRFPASELFRGAQGPRGEKGDPFNVNTSGPLSGKGAHDAAPKGFSYLADDTGDLYIKRSDAAGDWGPAVPFRGPQGVAGPKGEVGPQGPTGPQGDAGPQGPGGPQGLPGEAGPKGEAGQSFKPDATGTLAERGQWDAQPKGFSYLDVPNSALYFKNSVTLADWSAPATFGKGEKGDPGATGSTGAAGPAGAKGSSAYQVWLAAGNTGTEAQFLESLRGPRGATGAGIPTGGAVGQVVGKTGTADYALGWITPSAGPGASLKEFAHLATGNDWTAAWDAAVQKLKGEAIPGSIAGNSWQRLGTLRVPKGYFEIAPGRLLENMRGLNVVGEGADATILKIPSAGFLFDLHHDAEIGFSDLTIDGYASYVYPANGTTHQVPRENARAFRIRQASGDAFPGWGSVGFYFKRVNFKGLHASVQYAGDIQCDKVHFQDCRWMDCFNVFEYRNRNAVNHTISGNCEVQCFQGPSRQAMFNAALSSWAAFEPFHPAAPTIFDGAVFQVKDGGAVDWNGGGIIVPYAWILLESASGFFGTTTGLDKREFFSFENVRGEQNHTDTTGDRWGQERTALVRRNNPEFATPWAINSLRFKGCQFGTPGTAAGTARALAYLYNLMELVFEDTHLNWGTGGGPHAIVGMVNAGTVGNKGRYRGRNDMRFGNFSYVRYVATGATAATGDNHSARGEWFAV